jgi:hypothetical protein
MNVPENVWLYESRGRAKDFVETDTHDLGVLMSRVHVRQFSASPYRLHPQRADKPIH